MPSKQERKIKMETITREFTIYSFDELSEEIKQKAIEEEINFILDYIPYEHLSPKMKKACKKAEEMQTPWFTGSYIWQYAQKEILNSLRRYKFFESGNVYNENFKP